METPPAQVLDLAALSAQAAAGGAVGAVWSLSSPDLNVNLVRFGPGDGVEAHVNAEVDVIGIVVAGEGTLILDTGEEPLRPGSFFFVPKGARRAVRAAGAELIYLSCHRRRAALMPRRSGGNVPPRT